MNWVSGGRPEWGSGRSPESSSSFVQSRAHRARQRASVLVVITNVCMLKNYIFTRYLTKKQISEELISIRKLWMKSWPAERANIFSSVCSGGWDNL